MRRRELQRSPLATLDLTRPQATVELSAAPGLLVAGPGEADRVIEHALQVGSALLAVEQVGAGQHLLDLTVEYAKSRLQFGRPIGSFQAIKHKLADLLVDLEHARSTAYHAVWALTDGSDDPGAGGEHRAGDGLCGAGADRGGHRSRCTAGSGSPGSTRRICTSSGPPPTPRCLGSAEQHRSRVAELVLDTAESDRGPRVADGTLA